MNQEAIDKIKRSMKRRIENPNSSQVVYCSRCQMWFDTKNGWFAEYVGGSSGPVEITTPGGGTYITTMPRLPICPACGAPLFEIDAEEFYENNREIGRLDEVMTWEWPNGSFWKKASI